MADDRDALKPSDVWAGEWLRLFRVPNLFTVVGDPLAGYVLAGSAVTPAPALGAALVVAAALCLYCAGLVLNDLFDLEEDRRERPGRPLPTGHIRVGSAIAVSILLVAAGLTFSFFAGPYAVAVAAILVAVIVLYNAGLKRVPIVGPLAMGSCRGLSIVLGASVVGGWAITSTPVVIAAIGMALYVASVTVIASHETESRRIGPIRFLPVAALVAWFAVFFLFAAPVDNFALAASLFGGFIAVVWSYYCSAMLAGPTEPAVVSWTIGAYLRGLLLIQAALIATLGLPGLIVAVVLLLFLPASRVLSQRFAPS